MNFDFTNEIRTYKDPDDSDLAKKYYSSFFEWSNESMRGDTICSFGTTFGACNKSTKSELKVLVDGRSWKRGYTKDIFEDEHIKKEVHNFRRKYHSLANFWIMPRTLNTWRGRRVQGDYFDIFLDCIRNFYLNNNQNPLEVKNRFNEKGVKNWLDSFGEKEEGWRNFIKLNYLSAYVREVTLEVKDIFSENFQDKDADEVGTYHEYGKSLPQDSKNQSPKDSATNFVNNSLWAICERAIELEEAKIDY